MSGNVAIIHNKISDNPTIDEVDVLSQVKVVNNALQELGYKTEVLHFSLNIEETIKNIKEIKPDFIFNLVESIENDGQLICIAPAIFDYLKIPYTGCTKEAMFLTSNKVITKKIMASNGIKTPEWVTTDDEDDNVFIEEERYIIKAIWEDASICLEEDSVVSPASKEELIKLIKERNEKNNIEFFAERYIHGRDLSTPVLAGTPLSTREVRFVGYEGDRVKVVGYKAKWEEETEEFKTSIMAFDFEDHDREMLDEVSKLAALCWKKFNLKGYARIDFRVDEAGVIYVLEINANSCLSPDSAFYDAICIDGMTFNDAIKNIINDIKYIYPSHNCKAASLEIQ
jgi:D-alanine-D-alanine ligase